MPLSRILGVTICAALVAIAAARRPALATPVNIVAIGASNTAGWGVGTDQAYPALLQQMLRERGYDAHVANAGVSFSTTSGMLKRLDRAVPVGTSIVILQPGGNDTRFFGTKTQREKNIAAIVERLRARHIRVIVFENDVVPHNQLQWDRIHFTRKGHATAAVYLLRQVIGEPNPERASDTSARRSSLSAPTQAPTTDVSPARRT